jgi:hypothetical protein
LAKEPEERDVGARVVLVRARGRVLGLRCGLSTATVRWRPSRAPASVARANGDSGEGNRAGLKERMTRGRRRSRRWTAAACTVAAGGSCTGGRRKQSRGGTETEGVQRKKKKGKRSGGLV